MEHKGLEERVLTHDRQLVKIETILERVASNQDDMTQSLKDIANTLSKMNTLEDSIKRVHHRIDSIDVNMQDINNNTSKKFESLSLVFMILKYPRFALLALIGLYAFAISDIRNTIIAVFKIGGF